MGKSHSFMLTAVYEIKWVVVISFLAKEFWYSAVIHRVCFVICFLSNLKGGF